MKTALNKGFTLIEMSIVMLVLAVLTGSILIGRDLIHAAELRSTIKQAEMFNLAYNAFQLKYNCWPGDCGNAGQMGFEDGFSIQLSKNEEIAPETLIDYISPISTALAFTVMQPQVIAKGNVFPDGKGGLVNASGKPVLNNDVVPLNGDHNCSIENNPNASLLEGPTGFHMIQEANMISGLDSDTRVYLKLSSAFAVIGNKTFPAFWVVGNLSPGTDEKGKDSVIDTPGAYLQIIASYQPFAAASLPAMDAYSIDVKIDDGSPLGGQTRASSTAQTNLALGPTLNPSKDIGPKRCLDYAGKGNGIIYNISETAEAKCAQVIRLNIGSCGI